MRVPGVRFVQGRNRYGTSTKYAIAVHATANTASAANEAAYATRRTDGTSSHFYADNVEVIQSLDTDDRAGHAGSTQGNTYAIAVEFTGLNSWSRGKWLSSVAWDKIGAVLAAVSRHHNIPAARATVAQMKSNPRVRGSYDHNQMRLAWGATDHTDPGPNFPWDHLLAVWQRHLSPQEDDMTPAQFLAIVRDPTVATEMRRLPWQYVGGGIPAGKSTLGVLNDTYATVSALGEVIARESANPDEVRAILAELPRPTAEEHAQVLMAELGERSPDEAAQSLVGALGPERAAALASAVLGSLDNTPAS